MSQTDRALRPNDVVKKLGVGKSTIWRWAQELHDFPKKIVLGPRCVVFMESELDAFIESRRNSPLSKQPPKPGFEALRVKYAAPKKTPEPRSSKSAKTTPLRPACRPPKTQPQQPVQAV